MVKSTHLKPYSCKFSKKTYTKYQLLVLILFKDYRNQHYREFIEDVGDMENVQETLDLSVVPHFTTLQKFLRRIKSFYLRLTFKKTVDLFYTYDDVIPCTAIDSSGFTSSYASHNYSWRTGKTRKRFMKTSISVDTDEGVITGYLVSLGRVHDTRHAEKLPVSVIKSGSLIATSWIKDTILKVFIDRSGKRFERFPISRFVPGMLHTSEAYTSKKW